MEQPQTVAELDKIIQQKEQELQQKPPPVWGYIIASVIILPLGLYLSWRKKVLDLVLPTLLIIESLLFGLNIVYIFSALNPIFLLTELLKQQFQISNPLFLFLISSSFLLFLAGLILGIYYRIKVKKGLKLSSTQILILFGVLLLQIILSIGNYLFVVSFVYRSVESFPL